MKIGKKSLLTFAVLGILFAGLALVPAPQATTNQQAASSKKTLAEPDIVWNVLVTAEHPDGTVFFEEKTHNIITNLGADVITSVLNGTAVNYNVTNITLANCTAAFAVTDVDLCANTVGDIYKTTCALTPSHGKFDKSATLGAWNVSYQWTSSCDNAIINATGLYNATSTGAGKGSNLFAEANFTSVTLQTNDRLNVTWGLQVSVPAP